MAKKQALGKGLGALLPEMGIQEEISNQEKVWEIPLSQIHPNPNQPRKEFNPESLAELAESIRNFGIMQPLLLMEEPDGQSYMIVAGERRFRAAALAGLEKLPCIVRQLSPSQLAEASLIENIQREDLSPLEEAEAFRSLMDSYGYTQEKLAQRLGKSRPHVANTLRLLQLAPQERKLLAEGRISAGHARALLSIADPHLRNRLLELILKEELSVRQAEAAAKKLLGEGEDLVRLMTIHKSKGLEFPVTIVAGLGHGMHLPGRSRLILHKDLGMGMDYVNPQERITRPSLSKTAIALRKRLEEKAERARRLYVAMTRARERLILVGSVKEYPLPAWRLPSGPHALYAASSMLDWVCQALWKTQSFPGLTQDDSTHSTAYPHAAAPWKITLSGDIIHMAVEKEKDFHMLLSRIQNDLVLPVDEDTVSRFEKVLEPRPEPLPLKTSVSALCRQAPWDATEEDALEKAQPQWTVAPLVMSPLPEAPRFLSEPEEENTAAQRGTAVHQALAHLDYTQLGDARGKALYARVASQVETMAALTPEQKQTIPFAWLCRFLESPLGLRARRAQVMRREWAFNYRLPEAGGVLVQGVIDLCFMENGQWVLVDYKTDYYEDPALLKERYAPQLRIYRQALEDITRVPVAQTCLCGLRHGDEIEID